MCVCGGGWFCESVYICIIQSWFGVEWGGGGGRIEAVERKHRPSGQPMGNHHPTPPPRPPSPLHHHHHPTLLLKKKAQCGESNV